MSSIQSNGPWARTLPAAMLLLAPFNILASLAMDIYLPAVPRMPAILGTTPAVVQLTLTVYLVVLGLGQLLFGPVSDRVGRRPVLFCGALVFAGASFALAATTSAVPFVCLRLLQAAGASAALVALFASFVLPMWVMATGIALAVSVTANGALAGFDDVAGRAVALHFCLQSLVTGVVGTGCVVLLDGATAWPLVTFASAMAVVILLLLQRRPVASPS